MNQNNSNELYHHGILGMRWGVRRYQNKDGSLKPAGRKKMIKSMGKENYNKAKKKFKDKKTSEQNKEDNKKKTIKDLTNEELKERTTRMRLENDFTREMNTYKSLHPEKISRGKKFIKELGVNVIKPAAIEAGRNLLKNYMDKAGKEALGLNEKDPLDKLKREVEILEYENRKTSALSKRKPKKEDPIDTIRIRAEKARLEKQAIIDEKYIKEHTPKVSRYIKKKK